MGKIEENLDDSDAGTLLSARFTPDNNPLNFSPEALAVRKLTIFEAIFCFSNVIFSDDHGSKQRSESRSVTTSIVRNQAKQSQ